MEFYLQFQIVLFVFGFVAILGGGLFLAIRQWIKNNRTAKLSVPATVFGKRILTVWHSTSLEYGFTNRKEYLYYVTFKLENGECIEFCLNYRKKEYNRLKEGNVGVLNYQGTRYLGFEKIATKKKKYNEDGTGR